MPPLDPTVAEGLCGVYWESVGGGFGGDGCDDIGEERLRGGQLLADDKELRLGPGRLGVSEGSQPLVVAGGVDRCGE